MGNTVKTITLKEAFERSGNFSVQLLIEAIKAMDFKALKQKIIFWKYIKDGKNMMHMYCPECGNEWDEDDRGLSSFSTIYAQAACPCCGNDAYCTHMLKNGFVQSYVSKSDEKLVVLDIDQKAGYILFGEIAPDFKYVSSMQDIQECLDAHNFDFMHGKWECSADTSQASKIVFIVDKGFRVVSDSGKSLVPVSECEKYMLDSKFLIESQVPELCEFASYCMGVKADGSNVIEQMELYASHCIEARKNKRKTAAVSAVSLNDMFHPTEISENEIRHAEIDIDFSYGCLKDEYGQTQKIHAYCCACGNFSDITVNADDTPHDVMFKCPFCGHETKIVPRTPQNNCDMVISSVFFEIMPDTGYLVERLFSIHENFKWQYSRTLEETARVFFTDKQEYYFFHYRNSGWTKKNVPSYLSLLSLALMQDKPEIESIINQSVLKYSGLTIAWGLDGSHAVNEIGKYSKDGYISKWYKKPYMEQLLKVGLRSAVKNILNEWSDVENSEGCSPTEILGISKPALKIARELDLDLYDIESCNQFCKMDQTITAHDFLELQTIGSSFQFEELGRCFNISLRRIRDYLSSCYEHQCIEKQEALQLWSDYLRMAERLKYNLKDKDKKFPSSLKKEHDIASFAYKKIEDQVSKENFAIQYQKNKFYEYEKGNLMVKVPETAEDIISEANQQKNCAASYVNRVCSGETVVAFIRHKDAPETSYVTMEIFHGEIHQLKAFANAPVKDLETLNFVKEFALKKNLRVNFR